MINLTEIKTYPIADRKNLVSLKDFLSLDAPYKRCNAKELEEVAAAVVKARKGAKKVIVMFGAHLIKTGMSLFIIDLMKRGFISHLATNGAGSIHDFEIALIGATSEDVASSLPDGSFGMARETAEKINLAIQKSASGYGSAVGKLIFDSDMPNKQYSIFYAAYSLKIPITVHVAIGTDVIHMHPSCDGASLGKASHHDFKVFAEAVSQLEEGVILNIGSAVILPEVFLKSLSLSRNLGHKVNNFVAANLDMIRHYRPTVNVVERPLGKRGKGFNITGFHQNTIPTLYHYIIQRRD
jgi:hypothetical protein